MSGDTYGNTWLRLWLFRLRHVPGDAYRRGGGAFAIAFDSICDGARQGVRTWLHAKDVMPDAMFWLLKSNGLPSYRSDFDSPAGYAATMIRLAEKWRSHASSGTRGGMHRELRSAGFTDANVNFDDADHSKSEFWVTLPTLGPGPQWGSVNWGEFAWQVTGIDPDDASRLNWIVQYWQPARSLFLGLREP